MRKILFLLIGILLLPLMTEAGTVRFTGCTLKISNATGYTFTWCTVNNLANLTRPNDTLKIYDSSNRLLEVVVTGKGTAETLGATLNVTNCVNHAPYPYDTFDGASAAGFHAIRSTAGIKLAGTADEIVFVAGGLYKAAYSFTLTSGTAPVSVAARGINDTNIVNSTIYTVIAGANNYYFTASESTTGVVEWYNTANVEFTIASLAVKQVTAPSATGILFRQVSVASGFDYNSTYTVDIIHRGGMLPSPIPFQR